MRAACARLVGTLPQVPPAFSAKRVAGERLYDLARAGRAVPREPWSSPSTRSSWSRATATRSRSTCAARAGTYVRALARDLGEALGTGAHLTALRRTRSGGFGLDAAVPLERVGDAASLLPLDALLPDWPAVQVGTRGAEAIGFGRDLTREMTDGAWPDGAPHVRVSRKTAACWRSRCRAPVLPRRAIDRARVAAPRHRLRALTRG